MTEPTQPPAHENAPDSLIATWNLRRRALTLAKGESLPPADADLGALLSARVPAGETLPRPASAHALKRHEVRVGLAGHTELAALNALLIAHLRKKRFPSHAPALFRRIWAEQGDALLAELPARWLISSVITFGEHGETEGQRRIGLAMNVLFSLVKLYEFERLYSGQPGEAPFALRRRKRTDLPLDMPGFSLLSGGLDVNLLAQVWDMARDEPVAGRIACHLLEALNHDPRNLFHRIGQMRGALGDLRNARRARKDAASQPDGAQATE